MTDTELVAGISAFTAPGLSLEVSLEEGRHVYKSIQIGVGRRFILWGDAALPGGGSSGGIMMANTVQI